MSPKFKIEQIALYPEMPERAKDFLKLIGLTDWTEDHVVANGYVHGLFGQNEADLSFNYQATGCGPLELEVLNYTDGAHWMSSRAGGNVSHIGMHVTALELEAWKELLAEHYVNIAQTVFTESHTNPHIANSRRYNYVIFDTVDIIGVDLKFIVRYNSEVK